SPPHRTQTCLDSSAHHAHLHVRAFLAEGIKQTWDRPRPPGRCGSNPGGSRARVSLPGSLTTARLVGQGLPTRPNGSARTQGLAAADQGCRREGWSMTRGLTLAELNGVVRKPRSRKAKAEVPAVQAVQGCQRRRWITVGMGCGIPGLSLALSSIGGRLLQEGHAGLGCAALVLCCSVLAVSLSHLAWAVRDITRSAW